MAGPFGSDDWNEYNLNPLTRIDWRASLVPAAAVIPAPIAYIKVVAVKKLVVGFLTRKGGPFGSARCELAFSGHPRGELSLVWVQWHAIHVIYCEQIRVFKAGLRH